MARRLGPSPLYQYFDQAPTNDWLQTITERFSLYRSGTAPTTSEVPENQWILHYNSDTATLGLWANNQGALVNMTLGGDVVGPASSTDNHVAFFSGTTGKLLKDNGITLTGTNTGDQTISLSGDVTGSGTGAFVATIANDAVTYAKMQNVSAADKLLGRGNAGSGDVQEITLGTGLTMSGTTLNGATGTGDVVGPAISVDNRVVFFDGATGKLIKDSGLTLSGSNTGDQSSIVGITGTTAQFNTALTDGDFATLAGVETLTNKTLTSPKINENVVLTSTATELNILDGATLTTTELNYVDGVTSAIQTQLDGKQPLDTQLTSLASLSYAGNASKFIRLNAGETDFEFATVSGTGDVVGPASAVNNRVVFFDGVTGKLIKDSGLTLSGSNTGDQTSIVGITGTVAEFNTALTGADFYTTGGTDVAVADGGTGASTLTGLLQGNGASAFTAVADSSTVGQVLRVTGAATYGWGALNLSDADAVTGTLPDGNLPTSFGAKEFTGAGTVNMTAPSWYFNENDQGVDLKLWRFTVDGGTFRLQTRTDADGAGINAWSINRSGNLSWAGTGTGDGSGISALNGTNITTGTVADARLPSSMATKTFTGTTTISALLDCSGASAGQIKFPATKNASADANTLDDYQEGTFTATATGMTTSPSTTARYVIVGSTVTITFDANVSGTSNATTFTLTGMPAEARPARTVYVTARTKNNGAAWIASIAAIDTGGVITFTNGMDTAAFTASGTKGFGALTMSYNLL